MPKGNKEAEIQYYIANFFGFKYIAIPNVNFSWSGCKIPRYNNDGDFNGFDYAFERIRHEADLILINENDYMYEVECKCSYSDFLADFKKSEKHLTKYTRGVYYAFDGELYAVKKDEIHKKLNDKFPEAGIIVANKHVCSIEKKPKYFKVDKIPIEVKIGLMRIGCQKWWRRK